MAKQMEELLVKIIESKINKALAQSAIGHLTRKQIRTQLHIANDLYYKMSKDFASWNEAIKYNIDYVYKGDKTFSRIMHCNLISALIVRYQKVYRTNFLIKLLFAHGNSKTKQWLYQDGLFNKQVSDWIRKHDGTAAVLIIFSCNSKQFLPMTHKSLCLIPNTYLGNSGADRRIIKTQGHDTGSRWNLYLPGAKEIDGYHLEYWINYFRSLR